MLYFYFLVLIIDIVAIARTPKSWFIDIINLLFIGVLVGGYAGGSDFEEYALLYETQSEGTFEIGYLLITSYFNLLGLSFQNVALIFSLASIIIVLLSVKKLKVQYFYFAFLYLLTLCFIDAVQMRQMLCYALFSLSVLFLSQNKRLFALLLLLVASTIQVSSLFFIPFVFTYKFFSSNKTFRTVVIIVLIICFGIFLNNNTIPYLSDYVGKYLKEDKLVYFETHARYGFIIYFFYFFVCWKFTSYLKNRIKTISNIHIIKYINVVYAAISYSCFAMPLVMLNNTFFRFFVFPLIPLLIIGAWCLGNIKDNLPFSKKDKRMVIYGLLLVIFSYNIFLQVFDVVKDVFQHNAFIGF